ncbi:hypothetical protein FHG87_020495 [Trinorchestia longiramus]|nr:hypothetical protein FHG87_020495 [Trinorchestia longiramus]
MRLTAINFIGKRKPYKVRKKHGQNQIKYAKFLWELGRRRSASSTGDKEHLVEQGIHVCSPADIISAPYETPKYEDFFPPKEEKKLVQRTLHRVNSEMFPLLALMFSSVSLQRRIKKAL